MPATPRIQALPDGCYVHLRPAGPVHIACGRLAPGRPDGRLEPEAEARRTRLAALAGVAGNEVRVIKLLRWPMAAGLLRIALLTSSPGEALFIACASRNAEEAVEATLQGWLEPQGADA